jgi:prophage DNA circulation protein
MSLPTQLKGSFRGVVTPKLRPGSFRGVRFGLSSYSLESGRRTVTHEFPEHDNPYTEDLGLKARTFQLDLFVLGSDVQAQRNALRAALEQKGPGTLVLPHLGALTVQVSTFTLSESYDSQRLASFSVSFIQPGKLEFPTAATNAGGAVSAGSTNASLRAGTNALNIDVLSAPASAAMVSLVQSSVSLVQTSAKRAALPNSFGLASDTVDAIQAMSLYINDSNALPGLVSTPDVMSYGFADIVFRLGGLGMTPLQAFTAYQRLLGDSANLFAGLNFPATVIGAVMAANASLFQDVVYAAIMGSAASAAVDADYQTFDQAVQTRQLLAAMFDVAFGKVLDETLFGYLQDLRAQSLPQIPDPTLSLPNVVSVRVPAQLPSLVLAHDLMNGSKDEQTIIDLNGGRNPWFIPNAPGAAVLVLR